MIQPLKIWISWYHGETNHTKVSMDRLKEKLRQKHPETMGFPSGFLRETIFNQFCWRPDLVHKRMRNPRIPKSSSIRSTKKPKDQSEQLTQTYLESIAFLLGNPSVERTSWRPPWCATSRMTFWWTRLLHLPAEASASLHRNSVSAGGFLQNRRFGS